MFLTKSECNGDVLVSTGKLMFILQAVFDCDTYQNTAHQKNANNTESKLTTALKNAANKMLAPQGVLAFA